MDIDKVCVLLRRSDVGESEGAAVMSSWCKRTGRALTPALVKRCNLPLYLFPEVVKSARGSGVPLQALIETGFCKQRRGFMDNALNLEACLREYGTEELCSVSWNDLTTRVTRSDVTQALSRAGKRVTLAQYLDVCTGMHAVFEGVQAIPYAGDVIDRGATRQDILGAFRSRRLSCSAGILVPLMRNMGIEPTLADVMHVAAFANSVNSFIYSSCASMGVVMTAEELISHGASARVLVRHMIGNACPKVWALNRDRRERGWQDPLAEDEGEEAYFFGGGPAPEGVYLRDSHISRAKWVVWKVQHAARKLRRRNAAIKIQRRLRQSLACPYTQLGRKRILREFSNMETLAATSG